MVVESASQAAANARSFTKCEPGMCLAYVHTWLEIPSREPYAMAAWERAYGKHPGDRTPPRAAPAFWSGGRRGFGHVALSLLPLANPRIRGTDMPKTGVVSTQDLEWVEQNWGLHYEGWAEGFNGVWIPYLMTNHWDGGLVFVAKLHYGSMDSDSVSRLRWRLDHHARMPEHLRPGQGNDYGPAVMDAVAYWQNHIDGTREQPLDGMSLSNPQANQLFGPAYTVIPK